MPESIVLVKSEEATGQVSSPSVHEPPESVDEKAKGSADDAVSKVPMTVQVGPEAHDRPFTPRPSEVTAFDGRGMPTKVQEPEEYSSENMAHWSEVVS